MPYRARDFNNANILKSIYYASHINYSCSIWGQNISTINRLHILPKKALRTVDCKEHNAHPSHLFHYSNIFGVPDRDKIENYLFINKYTTSKLPSIFTDQFTFSSMSHNCQTSFASKGNLQISNVQTAYHKKNVFIYMTLKKSVSSAISLILDLLYRNYPLIDINFSVFRHFLSLFVVFFFLFISKYVL